MFLMLSGYWEERKRKAHPWEPFPMFIPISVPERISFVWIRFRWAIFSRLTRRNPDWGLPANIKQTIQEAIEREERHGRPQAN